MTIGAWGREIGPWRLGFGLAAVAAVYLRIGFSLAGYQAGAEWPWLVLLTPGSFILALASGWKVMPFTRIAHLIGLGHGFLVLWFLILLWGLPLHPFGGGVARPQTPGDFYVFFIPMLALTWATSALARQGDRNRQW